MCVWTHVMLLYYWIKKRIIQFKKCSYNDNTHISLNLWIFLFIKIYYWNTNKLPKEQPYVTAYVITDLHVKSVIEKK